MYGELNQLGVVEYLQLIHDVGAMSLDCAVTYAKDLGDFLGRASLSEQLKYLTLSIGEPAVQVFLRRPLLRRNVVLNKPP